MTKLPKFDEELDVLGDFISEVGGRGKEKGEGVSNVDSWKLIKEFSSAQKKGERVLTPRLHWFGSRPPTWKKERGIKRVDQKILAWDGKRDIQFLVAGDDPCLCMLIKLGALYVPVGRR